MERCQGRPRLWTLSFREPSPVDMKQGTLVVNRRGIALVWTAIFLVVLFGMMGLSLEWGKTATNLQQLHNAADAAALAGAQMVKINQNRAVKLAWETAKENFVDREDVDLEYVHGDEPFANDMDIVLVRYFMQTHTYEPNLLIPNAVLVTARRTADSPDSNLPLVFGPAFHKDSVALDRYAIAISAGTTLAGLIALSRTGSGLSIGGGADVTVIPTGGNPYGEVQVDSFSEAGPSYAVRAHSGAFTLRCTELNVCGTADPGYDWEHASYPVFDDNPSSYISDPLGSLPGFYADPCNTAPTTPPELGKIECRDPNNGQLILTRVDTLPRGTQGAIAVIDHTLPSKYWWDTNTMILQPGYYSSGIRWNSTGKTLILRRGIYLLGGSQGSESGFVYGGGIIDASAGVMLYITKSRPNNRGATFWGTLKIVGAAGATGNYITINEFKFDEALDPPAYAVYDGMAIFQDRNNTKLATLNGGSEVQLTGTLYFRFNTLDLEGSGLQAGTQLIANKIEVAGGARVWINYDGRNIAVGYRSWLVE